MNLQTFKNIGHYFNALKAVILNGQPAKKLTVIGVTGTDGKTTTSHLIAHILNQSGKPTTLISTLNAGLHTTTPNPNKLQKLLKKAVKEKKQYAVIEATSHGLNQNRLLGCNLKIGALTNVTPEHLDYHNHMKNYLKAKSKLFKKVEVAVLNKDDKNYNYFKNKTNPKAEIVSYSIKKPARFKVVKSDQSGNETKFLLQSGRKKANFQTNLIGKYNLSNILAAVAVTRKLGVPWEKIEKAVASYQGITGRMEYLELDQKFDVIIDFAHTPNALENALKTLKRTNKNGQIIAVLGCAGQRDYQKRPEMGKISTKLADLTIFTAEDPRNENVNEIISQMTAGINGDNYLSEPDRQKAINLAVAKAKPKDTVVIFGKGHEESMCYGNEEKPWSEHQAVKKALSKRPQ